MGGAAASGVSRLLISPEEESPDGAPPRLVAGYGVAAGVASRVHRKLQGVSAAGWRATAARRLAFLGQRHELPQERPRVSGVKPINDVLRYMKTQVIVVAASRFESPGKSLGKSFASRSRNRNEKPRFRGFVSSGGRI